MRSSAAGGNERVLWHNRRASSPRRGPIVVLFRQIALRNCSCDAGRSFGAQVVSEPGTAVAVSADPEGAVQRRLRAAPRHRTLAVEPQRLPCRTGPWEEALPRALPCSATLPQGICSKDTADVSTGVIYTSLAFGSWQPLLSIPQLPLEAQTGFRSGHNPALFRLHQPLQSPFSSVGAEAEHPERCPLLAARHLPCC